VAPPLGAVAPVLVPPVLGAMQLNKLTALQKQTEPLLVVQL
jgi:hypothetical protein